MKQALNRLQARRGAEPDRDALLLVGGADGVGSIAIHLARRLTGLRTIATASRHETRQCCPDVGARRH